LSSPQSAANLPAELRSVLPRQGLVNHPEALAVVQALEELIDNVSFRAEAAAWQHTHSPAGCNGRGKADNKPHQVHQPAIILTALYDSQVRLLRLLVGRSALLARAGLVSVGEGRFRLGADGLEVIIDAPPALRQRECLALLLSLTRSHSHRAVALGEQACWLP